MILIDLFKNFQGKYIFHQKTSVQENQKFLLEKVIFDPFSIQNK